MKKFFLLTLFLITSFSISAFTKDCLYAECIFEKDEEGSCATFSTGNSKSFNPFNPASSGYGLVFDEEFNDISGIDFSTEPSAGYNFYTANLIGCKPRPKKPKSIFSVNNGILRDAGYPSGCGYDISSAGFLKGHKGAFGQWSNNWVGTAFGKGAYFEARIRWTPKQYTGDGVAHVAWWANSVEASFQNGTLDLPEGFPHMNFVEVDFLENDGSPKIYSASLLHWCDYPGCGLTEKFHVIGNDVFKKSSPSNFSNNHVSLPEGDKFSNFHVFGTLWLYGGAPESGGKGVLINFLDGVPTGSQVYWHNNFRFDDKRNNPPTGYNIFSTLDQQYLTIILGTGPDAPIEVDWVHVWQLPEAAKASGNSFIEPQKGFTGAVGLCPPLK